MTPREWVVRIAFPGAMPILIISRAQERHGPTPPRRPGKGLVKIPVAA